MLGVQFSSRFLEVLKYRNFCPICIYATREECPTTDLLLSTTPDGPPQIYLDMHTWKLVRNKNILRGPLMPEIGCIM
jgi:hypothetical protein